MTEAIDGLMPGDDFGTHLYPHGASAHWNIWSASYDEAKAIGCRSIISRSRGRLELGGMRQCGDRAGKEYDALVAARRSRAIVG